MIKSMTGYGRCEKQFDEYRITAEVKTVNNRYLDINTKIYKQYSFVEEIVRETVSSLIKRGKADISFQFDNLKDETFTVTLNEEAAKGYYDALKEMGDKFGLLDDLTVSKLGSYSDVFTVERKEKDKEKILADSVIVLKEALRDLIKARETEGSRLSVFFKECISNMRSIVDFVEKRSPATVAEYKERMVSRIEELLKNVPYDEGRLLTEVAIFSDKVNITEEITRFRSHLQEFETLLDSDIPIGRKLDFIIQELNREANTMGSKCNDIEISKKVIELKSEIEKIREQVQNIE
ncbi:MAG: YicC family protein [Ruminococcaceae bacterium]|nr:YicC family protein [Oscillospiraceae bacterium]